MLFINIKNNYNYKLKSNNESNENNHDMIIKANQMKIITIWWNKISNFCYIKANWKNSYIFAVYNNFYSVLYDFMLFL